MPSGSWSETVSLHSNSLQASLLLYVGTLLPSTATKLCLFVIDIPPEPAAGLDDMLEGMIYVKLCTMLNLCLEPPLFAPYTNWIFRVPSQEVSSVLE